MQISIENPDQILFYGAIAVILITVLLVGRYIGLLEGRGRQGLTIRRARKDAVKRSRAVLGGQISEQLAPFLPDFPCLPDDVRFLGKPVDFIGFSGLGSGDAIEEILFIEVKTGSSVLSKREREVKRAIEEHRVRYVEYHPD
jgi:predicted Holliday junction resolvase-like endonuclease